MFFNLFISKNNINEVEKREKEKFCVSLIKTKNEMTYKLSSTKMANTVFISRFHR